MSIGRWSFEPHDPLAKLTAAILDDPKLDARIEDLGPGGVALRLGDLPGLILICAHKTWTNDLPPDITAAIERSKLEPVEIAVIGGPNDVLERIKEAAPFFQGNRIRIYHLGDDGQLNRSYKELSRTPFGKKIQALADNELADAPIDAASIERRLEQDRARTTRNLAEIDAFNHVLSSRRPIATYVLLALIGAAFAMELSFGGADSAPVLVRMGALVPERVLQGEWWRLLSTAFLHGSPLHILMNGYVLFLLGTSFERAFGTQRFIVLYTLAALGGSLASAFLAQHPLSVGASGALWGLLGAQALVAFRATNLVPSAAIPLMRRAAITNLIINVLISMTPRVDFSAHLGGGIVGALLVLTGLITRGLPPLADVRPDQPVPPDRLPLWIQLATPVCTVALLGCFALAIATGRPWDKPSIDLLARENLTELGITAVVPAAFGPGRFAQSPEGGGEAMIFGDLSLEGVQLAINSNPLGKVLAPEELPALIEELRQNLHPPDGFKLLGELGEDRFGPHHAFFGTYEAPNEVRIERVIIPLLDRLWVIEAALLPGSELGGLAQVVARSIRTSSTAE